AGASKASDLPSSRELAKQWATDYGFMDDEVNTTDLVDVATAVAVYTTWHEVQDRLSKLFAPSRLPSYFHQWLARQSQKLIVTTNYDCLIEQAFHAAGRSFHVVMPDLRERSPDAGLLWWRPRLAVEPVSRRDFNIFGLDEPVIYKLHGGVAPDLRWQRAVVTEDDHFDIGGRIYARSLLPPSIGAFLSERSFLFVGYSLRDVHVRQLLFQMQPYGGQSSFVVALRPARLDAARLHTLNFHTFDMSADAFARLMEQPD